MADLQRRLRARLERLGENQKLHVRLNRALDALALLEVLLVLIDWGYFIGRSTWAQWGYLFADAAVLFCFVCLLPFLVVRRKRTLPFLAGGWLVLVAGFGLPEVRTAALLISARQLYVLLQETIRVRWVQMFIRKLEQSPAQLLALSFLSMILVGAFLLSLPLATETHSGTSWIDALFTATSAVCVTGLIVVDTPVHFSRFGECVLLVLMQAGGLGMMTLSTATILFSGQALSSRNRRMMQDMFEESKPQDLPHMILFIVRLTFLAELAGAVLLFLCFWDGQKGVFETAFVAAFHSVSAFCNAGFSMYSDSLVRYQSHPGVNLTVAGLIVVGGLGFTVVAQLLSGKPRAFSMHTKLVLLISGLLLALGTILIFFFEFDNALLGLTVGEKLLAAFFQSVTLRTAGFNTIGIDALRPITLFFMIVCMFVGGSPASTAGGIKTTTLAVLALSVQAMLTGRRDVEVYGRTVPQHVVYKATAIAVISFVLLSLMFALLLIVEPAPFERLLFEAVSAFGTVGLSTGITSRLTTWGKLILIVLMFVGRIGPLTLTLALGEHVRRVFYRLPQGRVVVG